MRPSPPLRRRSAYGKSFYRLIDLEPSSKLPPNHSECLNLSFSLNLYFAGFTLLNFILSFWLAGLILKTFNSLWILMGVCILSSLYTEKPKFIMASAVLSVILAGLNFITCLWYSHIVIDRIFHILLEIEFLQGVSESDLLGFAKYGFYGGVPVFTSVEIVAGYYLGLYAKYLAAREVYLAKTLV